MTKKMCVLRVVLLLPSLYAGSVVAKQCKISEFGSNTFSGKFCITVCNNAKNDWRGGVSNKYGSVWSNWSKAKDKNEYCYGPRHAVSCYVSAKPCS